MLANVNGQTVWIKDNKFYDKDGNLIVKALITKVEEVETIKDEEPIEEKPKKKRKKK